METKKIITASLLDIVFDGKNKEYGAYQLRKTYNKRLLESLCGMLVFVGLVCGIYFSLSRHVSVSRQYIVVRDVQLEDVKMESKNEPLPPPPPKAELPKVEITKFTPPKIVKDDEVKAEETPPEQNKLENTHIGVINQEGVKDDGITAPPSSDNGKGLIEAPGSGESDDRDKVFTKVEIESTYPGGLAAWQRFLNKNLRYPDEALNNQVQGIVMVQFIVDGDGNVSDVHVISGPGEGGLREEAMRVIQKSGKWIPGIQNGRKVKSYKDQPIIFMMASQ